MQVLESVFVTGVESVPSIHFEFALSHLLSLLNLVLRELNSSALVLLLVVLVLLVLLLLALAVSLLGLLLGLRLLLLAVVVGGLFGAGLLRDFALHQVDRIFLKLLPDLLFLAVPVVFKSVGAVPLVLSDV